MVITPKASTSHLVKANPHSPTDSEADSEVETELAEGAVEGKEDADCRRPVEKEKNENTSTVRKGGTVRFVYEQALVLL